MSSDRENSDLIAESVERAEHFRAHLPDKIEIRSLTPNSKLPFKVLSLREILLHRFSDQSWCAAKALNDAQPVSAATLTRGSMESFSRLYEVYRFLSSFFSERNLSELDTFLMNRLFGTRNNDPDFPVAVNIMTAIDKTQRLVPHYRENYDRLSEISHPNYLGGVGIFQRIDRKNHIVYFDNDERKQRALRTVVYALLGTQEGFEKIYDELELPIRKLNDLFESGDLKHEAKFDQNE